MLELRCIHTNLKSRIKKPQNTIAAEDDRGRDGTEQVCLGLLPFGPDPVHIPALASDPAVTRGDGKLVL